MINITREDLSNFWLDWFVIPARSGEFGELFFNVFLVIVVPPCCLVATVWLVPIFLIYVVAVVVSIPAYVCSVIYDLRYGTEKRKRVELVHSIVEYVSSCCSYVKDKCKSVWKRIKSVITYPKDYELIVDQDYELKKNV
jgi:hypothetical protein